MIGCETTLTLQNWRWCCYGNYSCCTHLWAASQVKYLIKNFWCMPKAAFVKPESLFVCIWGRLWYESHGSEWRESNRWAWSKHPDHLMYSNRCANNITMKTDGECWRVNCFHENILFYFMICIIFIFVLAVSCQWSLDFHVE